MVWQGMLQPELAREQLSEVPMLDILNNKAGGVCAER